MKIAMTLAMAGYLSFAAAAPAHAQLFYGGVRVGAGIPTGTFAETRQGTSDDGFLRGANAGLGYGLDAGFGAGPLGFYGSYDRIDFGCDRSSCAGGKYKLSGVSAGVRMGVPLVPIIKPWVKAGITFHEIATTGSGGTSVKTDRRPGYELGAGVDIPVMILFSLTPQVRYVGQSLNYKLPLAGSSSDGRKKASFYTFDLGFRVRSPI
jgi:hypothetical protein